MSCPKRVLCVMDLSGVGRSSLSVVLPTLSACGVQACALPTALLSAHTGGFGEIALMQADDFIGRALRNYQQENIYFDAVYVGYLQSEQQFYVAQQAMRYYSDSLCIVDPAMADNGRLYSGITPLLVDKMKELCDQADIITPNWTESAILASEDMSGVYSGQDAVLKRVRQLEKPGRSVLITSAPANSGGLAIVGSDSANSQTFEISTEHVPQNYPGTGDLFTSALVGLLLRGEPLKNAAQTAACFVKTAAQITYEGQGETRHGVWFEQALPLLMRAAKNVK